MLWLKLIRSSKRCPGGHCLGYDSDILLLYHEDVIKWKHFPRYWPFVRGIHRSPVNSPHKGQWRGALMFSLICVRINGWVNNRYAGDLRRHQVHHDVIVTITYQCLSNICFCHRHLCRKQDMDKRSHPAENCLYQKAVPWAWIINIYHRIIWGSDYFPCPGYPLLMLKSSRVKLVISRAHRGGMVINLTA